MQPHLSLGALTALLLQTASASAAPPTWCRGGDEKPSYDLKSMFTEADASRALQGLVAAMCYPEADVAPYTKQIAVTRAAWSKRLGLTEADWTEVNEWAHLSRELRNQDRFFATDRKAAWTKYSPLDQFAVLAGADIGPVDAAYVADAFGSKLTQLGRLGYVVYCLGRAQQDDGPVALAMCATDVAALDMTKIATEIAADKSHNTADRMTARIVGYETLEKRPQLTKDIAALRAKEPAYDKMFPLGEAAHKAWAGVDAKLVQLASDLDDARVSGSRRASQGCMPRALEAWQTAVASIGAKRLAQIHPQPGNGFAPQLISIVIAEPAGYLAALVLTECATLEEKPDFLTRAIGGSLRRWPGFRGPRTGTQTAVLTADLQLDERGSKIEYPELSREWITGDKDVMNAVFAAVASVKVEGDKATVTFAKQKIKQTRCTKGHYTSRISQIMSDGTIVYYYVCDKEINETIEVAPSPPVKVTARSATDLKPGMTASISDDVVVVAYPKNSTTPSLVTGVKVQ